MQTGRMEPPRDYNQCVCTAFIARSRRAHNQQGTQQCREDAHNYFRNPQNNSLPQRTYKTKKAKFPIHRRQFMLEQTREQRVIQSKHLLKKIKYAEAPEMLWVLSDEQKYCPRLKDPRRNGNPTEVPVIMHISRCYGFGCCEQQRHATPTHFFTQGLPSEFFSICRGSRDSSETLD